MFIMENLKQKIEAEIQTMYQVLQDTYLVLQDL